MNLVVAHSFFLHDLWHPLSGRGYQFWSGIAGEFGWIIAIAVLVRGLWSIKRHFECHCEQCHKLATHQVEGTPYRTCWSHHPVLGQHTHRKVSLEKIHLAHRQTHDTLGVPLVEEIEELEESGDS